MMDVAESPFASRQICDCEQRAAGVEVSLSEEELTDSFLTEESISAHSEVHDVGKDIEERDLQ